MTDEQTEPPMTDDDRLFAANAILAFLRMGVCPAGYDRDDLRGLCERILVERGGGLTTGAP